MLHRFFTKVTEDKEVVRTSPVTSEWLPSPKSTKDADDEQKRVPVVAVIGAKGGVGATTIAVDLAAAMALNHISTTLIDGNFQQPAIAYLLGKEPLHSITELFARIANLDKKLFEACVTNATDSSLALNLLSSSLDGESGITANLSDLANCLNLIGSYSGFWVVDLPNYLDKHLVTLTDMCAKIILVFEATVTGVATSRRWLSVFQELGYDKERIICVLNRAGSKFKGVEQQLAECFGDRFIFQVPNASALSWDCSTRGVPIVLAYPNHPYSRALGRLADYVSQEILV